MLYSRILLPVDGSAHSLRGVSHAVRLAGDDAEVIVATVIAPLPSILGGEPRKEAEEAALEEARLATGPVLEKLAAEGVKCRELIVRNNSPADGIVGAVEETGSEIVVMGSRGRSDFEGLFLGSVTHRVLMHSTVPVLVVH